MAPVEISADEARRMWLRAQGVLGGGARREGPAAAVRRLGAVQLDTISVLARSHELVAYARLGPVPRAEVERSLWDGSCFEYWAHAACVLPLEQWPSFAFRRRRFRARGWRWHQVDASVCERVLERLDRDGPLTSTELGGAKKGGPWWDWSDVKVAVEFLLDVGDVVCVQRRGWKRVYDLAARAIPAALLAQDLDDLECRRRLLGVAGRALAVGTVGDLADFHRTTRAEVREALDGSGLVPVEVAGWGEPAWADPDALAAGPPRGRHRTTLLSPFDTLVWDRPRTERVFGLVHRLEAYTPAARRVHGYFTMPLLHGGRVVGRVDPVRRDGVLEARRWSCRPGSEQALETALREAAAWVGLGEIALGERRDWTPRA